MKELLVSVFLLMSMGMYAQKDSVVYAYDAEGKALKAVPLEFEKPIYSFCLSPDANTIAIKMCDVNKKGKWKLNDGGLLYVYSLLDNKSVIKQELSYMSAYTYLTNTSFLYRTGTLTRCYSLANPETLVWEERVDPILVNDSLNFIIGYKTQESMKLRGLEFSTGKVLWEKSVPCNKNWGWNEKRMLSDSLIVVANNNLDFLNPKTGDLHYIKAYNGYVDKGAIFAAALGGIALGAFTGAFTGFATTYVPYVGPNVIAHTCSNIVYRDERLFFSDKRVLMCLDTAGNKIWNHTFKSDFAACAHLQMLGDKLCMINYGYGLKGGSAREVCGKPFISNFDISTGEITETQILDPAIHGTLTGAFSDTLYVFTNPVGKLTPIYPNSDRILVLTDKDKLLLLDKDLNVVDEYPFKNSYDVLARSGNLRLVGSPTENDKLWLVYADGTPIMHIELPVNCIDLRAGKLIMSVGKQLIVQDLNKYL